ncbi:pleckstrin homology domain-containing family G member 3 isoform X2 [Dunckerocampus dactyliophorus]|uniref:pleckstrin homology domain-containing family G member 3 isoform X2 n=1 Tax=Dunckerocampus dactyliophorus TaxID=161453 RepID=UPI0024050858|nr:pleckstrin homology domain-containing family G member 3 isoform X2 [Dunckerocampus dactyliophorus]
MDRLSPPAKASPPIGSNDRASSSCDSWSGHRPASLISTLSSGSASSRDEGTPPGSYANCSLDPRPDEEGAGYAQPLTRPKCEQEARGLGLPRRDKLSSPHVTRSMAPNVQTTYLDRVVMEIIETERTYVRDLRMIVEDYLAHIIDQVDLAIRPEQVCFLFGNIEDIYEFNSELLQDLDLCEHDAVAVARCFVMKSQYFDIYTQYCTNYPNSVLALTECMQDSSLAVFFRDRQDALKRSLPLGSYLLKPVQRILKYHLLLQEIAKHFDPEEEGYEVVEEAIITMTGVAWYINDMKRKHEHAVRLQEVQSLLLNWKGPDLTTYGELVLEGTFKVHRAKNERTLFLLERVLLITKRRGEHFVYKTHISCSTLMLIESTKDSLSFSVTHYKQPKQPHTVQAKSVEEKEMWAHHIKRIILENHHALIPQKAKDAILSSRYPHKYRSSPDTFKKVVSRLTDEFPRRRSAELNKGSEKSSKGEVGVVSKEERVSKQKSGLVEEAGSDAAAEQMSTDELLPEEKLDSLRPSDSNSLSDELKVPGCTEEPPSAAAELQCKPSSSGESSEDEDGDQGSSILPSSVLDKAGVIAQHFSSIKRGVLVQDDIGSLGPSSRVPMAVEHIGPPSQLNSIDSDLSDVSASTDLTLLSPRGDAGQGVPQRRDSVLSSQDQLLIGKIRTYYDNAGNRDASFRLQRRESLTYIPAGLVKTSISRLNSSQTSSSPPAVDQPPLTPNSPSGLPGLVFSSDCLDTQSQEDPKGSGSTTRGFFRSGSQSIEKFRPSSEMVQVWQVMEQHLAETSSLSEVKNRRFQEDGGASVLGAITEESSNPSSLKHKTNDPTQTGSPTNPPIAVRAQLLQLTAETADEDDKAENKVRHLARQYSQRIKTVQPLVRQRSYGSLMKGNKLTCVVEESSGRPNLSLGTVPPTSPVDQVRSVSPDPAGASPGRTCSRSPVSVPQRTEGFNWPDVRELRSKYSDQSGSTLEQKFDVGPRERFCSSSGDVSDAPSQQLYNSRTTGRHETYKRLHRTNSLDPRLAAPHVSEMSELRSQQDANDSDDHVSVQVPLFVTGKLSPEEPSPPASASKDEDDLYVQIRSPTSREKISIMAVIDRCRAYRESDEYKERSESLKSTSCSGDDCQRASTASGQNSVKSLREKFQNLNS